MARSPDSTTVLLRKSRGTCGVGASPAARCHPFNGVPNRLCSGEPKFPPTRASSVRSNHKPRLMNAQPGTAHREVGTNRPSTSSNNQADASGVNRSARPSCSTHE